MNPPDQQDRASRPQAVEPDPPPGRGPAERPLVPLGLTPTAGRCRSRRLHETRPITLSAKRDLPLAARAEAARLAELGIRTDHTRPSRRDECWRLARPCPFVGCRHHLFLDVDPENGSIKFNFPDLKPDQLVQTCSLDVAEHQGCTLEGVAEILNLTRERVRQIEARALARLEARADLLRHLAPER